MGDNYVTVMSVYKILGLVLLFSGLGLRLYVRLKKLYRLQRIKIHPLVPQAEVANYRLYLWIGFIMLVTGLSLFIYSMR